MHVNQSHMEDYQYGQRPEYATNEGREVWWKAFLPGKKYFVTPVVIAINLVVFGLMVFQGIDWMSPTSAELLDWGGNLRSLVLRGEYYRLLTACFLHIGIIHLALNMYALLMIGVMLEKLIGSKRFLTAYLVTGFAASVTSVCWHSNTVSAGASGAIFGMYGVFFALLTTNLIERNARRELLSSIGLFIIYNLAFGLKGGVDNAGHIGGLVSGILFGYGLTPALRSTGNVTRSIVFTAGISVVILGISSFALTRVPKDMIIYHEQLDLYTKNEEVALETIRHLSDNPSKREIRMIENQGLPKWKENLGIVLHLKGLDLDEEFARRVEILDEYTQHRIEYYELLIVAMKDTTKDYSDELLAIDMKVRTDLNSME